MSAKSPEENARLSRLVGDPDEVERKGGGFPLTIAFTAILNRLQDHRSASVDDLLEEVEKHAQKKERAAFVYKKLPKDGYQAFVKDLLDQLSDRGLVTRNGNGLIERGPSFEIHKPLEIIYKREGVEVSGCSVTVHTAEEREARNQADFEAQMHTRVNTFPIKENIRVDLRNPKLDAELRESLKEFGWLPELPGLMDEHDTILIGNRRNAIAQELIAAGHKIEPVFTRINIGNGTKNNAKRVGIMIASNLGAKPLTKRDRQHIVKHLYNPKDGWTMPRVGAALRVSHVTIVRDVGELRDRGEFVHDVQNPQNAADTDTKRRPGRPPGSKNKPKEVKDTGGKPSFNTSATEHIRSVLSNGPLSQSEILSKIPLPPKAILKPLEQMCWDSRGGEVEKTEKVNDEWIYQLRSPFEQIENIIKRQLSKLTSEERQRLKEML